MTDHEQTRQAVANVTVDDVCHLVRLGMAGESKSVEMYARKIAYRLRNDDSGLTQRLAEMLGRGDLLRESATPGPAPVTVSEAEVEDEEQLRYRVAYAIGWARWGDAPMVQKSMHPDVSMGHLVDHFDVWRDAESAIKEMREFLAARTTARAPEPNPRYMPGLIQRPGDRFTDDEAGPTEAVYQRQLEEEIEGVYLVGLRDGMNGHIEKLTPLASDRIEGLKRLIAARNAGQGGQP